MIEERALLQKSGTLWTRMIDWPNSLRLGTALANKSDPFKREDYFRGMAKLLNQLQSPHYNQFETGRDFQGQSVSKSTYDATTFDPGGL